MLMRTKSMTNDALFCPNSLPTYKGCGGWGEIKKKV